MTATRRHRTRRRSLIGLGLTAGGLALAVAAMSTGTGALFTDNATVAANDFTTGSLDLTVAPANAVITFSGMVPGDQVTRSITVANGGSAALRYALTSTTTENVLAAQLDLSVKSGVTTCTNAGFGASGTSLYGPADLGATTTATVFGNPATGPQAGDRSLAAGANETLCLNVSLPLTSANTYQSRSTTATFDFVAEQTANNP